MNIMIRNLDPRIVKTLEQMASENNISRNTLLIQMLEKMTDSYTFSGMESRYKMLLEKCLTVIENNTAVLQKLNTENDGE